MVPKSQEVQKVLREYYGKNEGALYFIPFNSVNFICMIAILNK